MFVCLVCNILTLGQTYFIIALLQHLYALTQVLAVNSVLDFVTHHVTQF